MSVLSNLFKTMQPIKNALLNEDGSLINFQGEQLKGADLKRAELYKTMQPIKNELLNEDGSTEKFPSGSGGGTDEVTKSVISLKNSNSSISVSANIETTVNFNNLNQPIVGEAFTWSTTQANTIHINKDCRAMLELISQIDGTTSSAGAEIKMYRNGAFLQNNYRRIGINTQSDPATVKLDALNVKFNAGEVITFTVKSTGGTLTAVTSTNHVALLFNMVEV